jgi:ribonuclease Y
MLPLATVISIIVSFLVGAAIAFFLGVQYRKKVAEAELGSAEEEAKRIVSDAIKNAESRKKEALVEAKDEIHKLRNDSERELKDRRGEVQRMERRAQQKEESLDKRSDKLEKKEDEIQTKLTDAEAKLEESEMVKRHQFEMLEKISGFTGEQAKEYLLDNLENELTHEKALRIQNNEIKLRDESDQKAKNIISQAIQRCASDHVAEITVSVVPLPNDEMKGRIIGREGRNIRSIETLTGVDLIIDDTPEAITLSGFDPVRREVARITLEKLIVDGRIHPARIEEMVQKAQKEVNAIIKEEGDRATFETNIHGLNPEIVKLLGRQKFRTSYGQNVLNHSIEVAHISGLLAAELGADVQTAKRAGLLHDIGKSIDHEVEGSHVTIGVDIARKYKESEEVIHAIEAHHGDVEPTTIVACIVQAADSISAARPGARRENIENYVKRLEKLEELTRSFKGIASCYAIQAGREIRVMVSPEEVGEDEMTLLARDIAKKIESELTYPGQIKVHVLRETKAIEYAK